MISKIYVNTHLTYVHSSLMTRGLEYLHEHCYPRVIHRDMKSSNILLDANFNAKVKKK